MVEYPCAPRGAHDGVTRRTAAGAAEGWGFHGGGRGRMDAHPWWAIGEGPRATERSVAPRVLVRLEIDDKSEGVKWSGRECQLEWTGPGARYGEARDEGRGLTPGLREDARGMWKSVFEPPREATVERGRRQPGCFHPFCALAGVTVASRIALGSVRIVQ